LVRFSYFLCCVVLCDIVISMWIVIMNESTSIVRSFIFIHSYGYMIALHCIVLHDYWLTDWLTDYTLCSFGSICWYNGNQYSSRESSQKTLFMQPEIIDTHCFQHPNQRKYICLLVHTYFTNICTTTTIHPK
jgi:hypothetical protein